MAWWTRVQFCDPPSQESGGRDRESGLPPAGGTLQVFLHVAPLCHIGGISSLLAMLMAGGASVFDAAFSAARLPALLRDHRVTALIAVPAMLVDVIQAQERGQC